MEVGWWIFIIHKDNNDIAHPWSETWHLYWINAQALELTFAYLSHPPVTLAFIAIDSALKGTPLLCHISVGTHMHRLCMHVNAKQEHMHTQSHAHTLKLANIHVHSSLMGLLECVTPANSASYLIGKVSPALLHVVLLRFITVPTNCIQQNHYSAYIC